MPIVNVDASLVGSASLVANALESKPLVASLVGGSALTGQLIYGMSSVIVGVASLTAHPRVGYAARASLTGGSTFTSFLNVVTGPVAPVRYNVPSRIVQAGKLVFDQVDLFLVDGKTRAQDVPPSALALRVFKDGKQLDWPLISGVGVNDVQTVSGKVYWTEFSAGFYSIRFFPNALGEWRILLTYPAFDQAVSLGYDVTPPLGVSGSLGLHSSFMRRLP